MLPELHAFKVLFYTESVGVVTFGHVTKMAVTPLAPQWPKTQTQTKTQYTQTLRLYLLQNLSYCRLKFYIAGIGNFAFFLRKIVENVNFFCSHPKKDVTVAQTHLLSHKTRKSVKRWDLYRCARNQKVTGLKNRHG